MDVDLTTRTADDLTVENARLRARVAGLEDELAQQAVRTNAIRAQAQERVFWLEFCHVDLNALMARPAARPLLWLMRVARWPLRHARQLRRRLPG